MFLKRSCQVIHPWMSKLNSPELLQGFPRNGPHRCVNLRMLLGSDGQFAKRNARGRLLSPENSDASFFQSPVIFVPSKRALATPMGVQTAQLKNRLAGSVKFLFTPGMLVVVGLLVNNNTPNRR